MILSIIVIVLLPPSSESPRIQRIRGLSEERAQGVGKWREKRSMVCFIAACSRRCLMNLCDHINGLDI